MFVVLLRFAENRSHAGRLMQAHRDWLDRGFEDGVFLVAGGIVPGLGGGILAHGLSLPELRDRVNADPFVAQNVVSAEILEIAPSKADARLAFILDAAASP